MIVTLLRVLITGNIKSECNTITLIQLLIINVVNSAIIIVREREKRGEGKDANIEKDRQ